MSRWIAFLVASLAWFCAVSFARAQEQAATIRHITLQEAVQLALQHNHLLRIAGYKVEESQHAKERAKSGYFPTIRNESGVLKVTDTQFIQIAAGELGTIGGVPNPDHSAVLSQGGKLFITSGTQLVQPLTQLFTRVKPENDIARANLDVSRANAQETENEVALKVHEIYYRVLIAQLHRSAVEAKIRAAQELQSERTEEVKYGSSLQQDLIESSAQALQAKQELLSTELALSDLTLQLNDVIGVPLTTQLDLDPTVPPVQTICEREECVKIALASHPEVAAARDEIRKASASVQLSKADYIPDLSALARYSYTSDVPFLARNFGTFGVSFTYDLFDGGPLCMRAIRNWTRPRRIWRASPKKLKCKCRPRPTGSSEPGKWLRFRKNCSRYAPSPAGLPRNNSKRGHSSKRRPMRPWPRSSTPRPPCSNRSSTMFRPRTNSPRRLAALRNSESNEHSFRRPSAVEEKKKKTASTEA